MATSRHIARSAGAALAAALLALALLAAPALARRPFDHVRETARTQHGHFTGAYAVSGFRVVRGRVYAVGRLTGTVADSRYPSPQRVNSRERIPVAVRPPAAPSCARTTTVVFARERVSLFGLYGTLAAVALTLTPPAPDQTICKLNRVRGAAATAQLLDAVRRSEVPSR